MQDLIRINGVDIFQPDEDLAYAIETTFTEDSTRLQSGDANFVPMFTVEQLSYQATSIPMEEATKILQMVGKGEAFTLHYFSVYYGGWRDGTFRVGKSNTISIGSLEENNEKLSSLSFNMTGDKPL
jgi:hypothetical protein